MQVLPDPSGSKDVPGQDAEVKLQKALAEDAELHARMRGLRTELQWSAGSPSGIESYSRLLERGLLMPVQPWLLRDVRYEMQRGPMSHLFKRT